MQKNNIIIISANDPLFPATLSLIDDPVKQLYALGNTELLKSKPRLGVVGSRRVTSYGREVTTDLVNSAARAGAIIVSGLAIGVDGIAHEAALNAGGSTIAVLPSSLRQVYPASHQPLARRILREGGLLISEYSKVEQPRRHYFIKRNRIIAAVSEKLMVTEAAMGSGTRHTVEATIAEGKDVLAVPGDINKHSSSYANYLLQHDCEAIFSTHDLLSILGLNENLMKSKYQPESEDEKTIIKALDTSALTFNELLENSDLEVSTLNIQLTMLEIKGAIEPIHHKWRLA